MTVRAAAPDDLPAVLEIHRRAFGGESEAELVAALLDDPSAQPLLSLLAELDGRPVGHILFTAAPVADPSGPVQAALLCPLAVLPAAQRQGVGKALIESGLQRLRAGGTALVFVLGDPAYYRRAGFRRHAAALGFPPPCPVPAHWSDAWQVQELAPGTIGTRAGPVACADALNRPELWRA